MPLKIPMTAVNTGIRHALTKSAELQLSVSQHAKPPYSSAAVPTPIAAFTAEQLSDEQDLARFPRFTYF